MKRIEETVRLARFKVYFWLFNFLKKMTEIELKRLLSIPYNDDLKDYHFFNTWTKDQTICKTAIITRFEVMDLEYDDIHIHNEVFKTKNILKINQNVFSDLLELGANRYNDLKREGNSEYTCIFKLSR